MIFIDLFPDFIFHLCKDSNLLLRGLKKIESQMLPPTFTCQPILNVKNQIQRKVVLLREDSLGDGLLEWVLPEADPVTRIQVQLEFRKYMSDEGGDEVGGKGSQPVKEELSCSSPLSVNGG